MTITADWQIDLPDRSLLMGPGTSYRIRNTRGLGGLLDTPSLRTDDMARTASDGMSLGKVYAQFRTLSWRIGVESSLSSNVTSDVRTLLKAWRAPQDGSEVALDVRVPGLPETSVRYYGQPRSVVSETTGWANPRGLVEVDCEFYCSDPFAYGASVADNSNTGTFTIAAANLGDLGADTDRVTLTITGNGGTPSITNDTTGGTIVAATALTSGASWTIDLHVRTLSSGSTSYPQYVSASTTWFKLKGGTENSLTLTSASWVDISYRPAFW